jgi:carbon storage regulator
MLVLTRKTNQSIVIGDDVEISVLAVAGDKVRIGIEAPRSVPVYRKEVWLEIQREGPRSTPTEPERRHVDEELQKLKSGD